MVPHQPGDPQSMARSGESPAAEPPQSANPDPGASGAGGHGGSLRASDADREQVNQVLSTAYAEGRLTHDEYDERTDQVLAAKTFDELIPITRDLVYAGPMPPSTAPKPTGAYVDSAHAADEPDRMVAIFSGVDRKGRWRIRRRTQALALFGGMDLDLREAVFDASEVEISGLWCFGGLDVKVPEGVEVRDHTMGIFGGTDTKKVDPPEPGAPVLILKGLALFGGIDVKTVRPKKKRPRRSGSDSTGDRLGQQLGDLGQQLGDRMDQLSERWEERRQDREGRRYDHMDRRQERMDRRQDRWEDRRAQQDGF